MSRLCRNPAMSRRGGAARGCHRELPSLIDVGTCSGLNFVAGIENLEDNISSLVYCDRGEELGHAIAKVSERFEKDTGGAFLVLEYMECSDEYDRWYVQHEGKRGGLPRRCTTIYVVVIILGATEPYKTQV